MNMNEIKWKARQGEFMLEECVIAVLYDVYRDNICLGAAEISKRAGIFREAGDGDKNNNTKEDNFKAMNDAIVSGILVKLRKENRVERGKQENDKGGWKLSESEFKKLEH